nr:PREDICTED: zinc finger C2HC domain-containing protein 1A [Latimeria chalumnae]|eukprot:XP_014354568.1 PREDICTED: zinc finger C2HC domain-containing protein 1A [Latimeria chalumnae]
MKEGGPLPPPPPPTYDPDYVQCPYCQRRFNENAAERHINFCKEQAARIPNKSKLATDLKGKPAARTQYKPTLKKTTPPGSTVAVTSRLPQPSNTGKIAGAKTSTSPTGYTAGNKAQTLSPARKTSNITSPQAGKTDILGPPLRTGRNEQRLYVSDRKTDSAIKRPKGLLPLDKGSLKSRSSTPPGGTLKSTGSSVGANKRKTYSSDNYTSRNDGKGSNGTDYSTPVNGMNMKISDPSGQKPKFCHGCGTKYPVEWAKFCCECGIKRMNL